MFKKKEKSDGRFFSKGWGDPTTLNKLKSYNLHQSAKEVSVALRPPEKMPYGYVTEGGFESPFPKEFLPVPSQQCRFKVYSSTKEFLSQPIVVLFAMTGDQGFSFRFEGYAKQLLKSGVASLLVENPFYGARRPDYQPSFFFVTVGDMLAMALAAVEEGKAIVSWLNRAGCSKIAVGGVSQAAMIAGAVGALTPFPIGVVCSLVAHSAEVILCDGLLKKYVDWSAIEKNDYFHTRYELIQTFSGTDLTRLPRPCAPQATMLQGAFFDLVAPRYSVKMIHRLWPGTELHWLPGTHLTSLNIRKRSFTNLVKKSLSAF